MCGMIISLEVSWKEPAERILLGTSDKKANTAAGKDRKETGCDPSLILVPDLNGKMSIMDRLREEYEQRKLMDFIVRG